MDARGNLVNNNMNTLLKNLTLINVVFLPLNLTDLPVANTINALKVK